MPTRRTFLALCVLWLATPVLTAAEDAPKPIPPENARQHVGETVTVTFEVKSSKDAKHRKTVFLDSEEDFMDEKNLGIAISEKGIRDLREKKHVEAPAEFYLRKRIRVRGKVALREERVYIDVDSADRIELVENE